MLDMNFKDRMIMKGTKNLFDREIFLRYLNGRGSVEERKMIQNWLMNENTKQNLFKESMQYWEGIDKSDFIHEIDGDSILNQIHHNIKIMEGVFVKMSKRPSFWAYFTRIAAVLTIPLIITTLFLYEQNFSYRNSTSWVNINAPYGTRTDFLLPDGSKGFLNGGSSLKFPTHFTREERNVELTGEAYFDVIPNDQKPFIVSIKNLDIKATGTSFNIMAYPEEPTTEVTLKNGIVEIYRKINSTVESQGFLKPDESYTYNALMDSGKIEKVNTADILSWLDGKLTFKYEPFGEVVRKLNRWYNVNILLKDQSLESYIYYGTFQNETLDEVLKLLQYTAPIKYKDYQRRRNEGGTFEKRIIEIYKK